MKERIFDLEERAFNMGLRAFNDGFPCTPERIMNAKNKLSLLPQVRKQFLLEAWSRGWREGELDASGW